MKILLIGNILNPKDNKAMLALTDTIKRLDQKQTYELKIMWPYQKRAEEYTPALRKAHLVILVAPEEYDTVCYDLALNNNLARFFVPERNRPIFNEPENYEKFIIEILPSLAP